MATFSSFVPKLTLSRRASVVFRHSTNSSAWLPRMVLADAAGKRYGPLASLRNIDSDEMPHVFVSAANRFSTSSSSSSSPSCSSSPSDDAFSRAEPKSVVEIERRFVIDANTEDNLKAAGAKLVSNQAFTDTYLDTSDFVLTGSDYWLRRRDGKWQLKYPSSLQLSKKAAEYYECEVEEEILKILSDVLPIELLITTTFVPQTQSDQASLGLSRLGDVLHDFCTIETRRKKFRFDDVIVDLDSADFGFAVGEMEVLVDQSGDLRLDTQNHRKALESIDSAASKIGIRLASDHRLEGKVTTFMKRYRKDHFDFLVEKGVIRPSD